MILYLVEHSSATGTAQAHTAKSMDIPQDIIDNVIAAVGGDTHLLKKCSLVSSSFLLPSRKQLFSRITLGSNLSDDSRQRLYQILVRNPVIKAFIRSISIEHTWDRKSAVWMNCRSLLAILRLPFCNLEHFSIFVYRTSDWTLDSFSSEMKDALMNIIHSSTLKTLSLNGITEVPITFFFEIVHLTTLELDSILPYDFIGVNSRSLARAASKGVAPIASHTVIDRCVWRFETQHDEYEIPSSSLAACFSLILDRELEVISQSIFLPFLCRLRFLEIYIRFYSSPLYGAYDLDILTFLIDSLCISLTSPASLEHLQFNIYFCDAGNYIDNPFYENFRDAWSHLDSIITYLIGSQLQRVDININYSFRYETDDDDEEVEEEFDQDKLLKSVLDGLPLLHTEGILFVKTALVEWWLA